MKWFSSFNPAQWVTLVLFLVLAVVLGALTPQLVNAMGPTAQADAADYVTPVLLLVGIMVQGVVSGGWIAFLLDDIGAWKNWAPASNVGKAVKKYGVLVLTALVAALLLWLEQRGVPQLFEQLPTEVQFALSTMAAYLASQVAHQKDLLFTYRKNAEAGMAAYSSNVRGTVQKL